ncbi:kunitz-type protease inhibitor 1 [Gastrophryne carolinensis]
MERLLLAASACLLLAAAMEPKQGQACLDQFTRSKPGFVLELNESVASGATFLASPPGLHRAGDCMAACCRSSSCNLALVQLIPGHDDVISSCFLLNCLYQQEFVCKFVRKEGFANYLLLDVSDKYLELREDPEGEDDPPIAKVSGDVKTQPFKNVILSGIDSYDREGIASYKWKLVDGDPTVVMEQSAEQPALLEVSNLHGGKYAFELVVTDTSGHQSSATVTVLVLTKEQTEEYCFAEKKTGRCRGSFKRWWFNSETNECESFTFGGCLPNKNNYVRQEDCTLACVDLSGESDRSGKGRRMQPVCDGHCHPWQFRCADGCCINGGLECDETPDCADQSDEAYCDKYEMDFKRLQDLEVPNSKARCVDLPETGHCKANFQRYYYSPRDMKCMSFTYGGCPGNLNNFLTQAECEDFCRGVTEQDRFAVRPETRDSQEGGSGASAEVAIAVFLGICILVVLAVIGYCYLRKKKNNRRRQAAANTNAITTTEDMEHLVYNRTTKPV